MIFTILELWFWKFWICGFHHSWIVIFTILELWFPIILNCGFHYSWMMIFTIQRNACFPLVFCFLLQICTFLMCFLFWLQICNFFIFFLLGLQICTALCWLLVWNLSDHKIFHINNIRFSQSQTFLLNQPDPITAVQLFYQFHCFLGSAVHQLCNFFHSEDNVYSVLWIQPSVLNAQAHTVQHQTV